jgi:hypothetical protein
MFLLMAVQGKAKMMPNQKSRIIAEKAGLSVLGCD